MSLVAIWFFVFMKYFDTDATELQETAQQDINKEKVLDTFAESAKKVDEKLRKNYQKYGYLNKEDLKSTLQRFDIQFIQDGSVIQPPGSDHIINLKRRNFVIKMTFYQTNSVGFTSALKDTAYQDAKYNFDLLEKYFCDGCIMTVDLSNKNHILALHFHYQDEWSSYHFVYYNNPDYHRLNQVETKKDRVIGVYYVDNIFNITTLEEKPIESTDVQNIYLVFLDYIYVDETRVEVQRKYYHIKFY